MIPFARAGARKRSAIGLARRVQPSHKIAGKERTVARHADEPGETGRMFGRPVQASKYASKWPGKIRHTVGNDGQTGIGKARGIAVGIDDDSAALRRQAAQHALKDSGAADADARFVAATHAAR